MAQVDRSEVAMIVALINAGIDLAVAFGANLTAVQIGALEGFAAAGVALASAYLIHRRDKAA